MNEIGRQIKKIVGKQEMVINGVVEEVDKNKMTCIVRIDNENKILASLVSGNKNKGIIQIPKEGSYVMVVMQERMLGFVCMVEEVEEVIINGGLLGGLIKIEALVSKLNSFIQAFNTHTHIVNTTGSAAAQSGSAQPITSSVEQVQKKDIEDERIKH